MEPLSIGTDAGAGAILAVLVSQLFQPLLEMWFPQGSPWHDNSIRLCALVLGLVWTVGFYLTHGTVTLPGTVDQFLPGLVVGGFSIGTYHGVSKKSGQVLSSRRRQPTSEHPEIVTTAASVVQQGVV